MNVAAETMEAGVREQVLNFMRLSSDIARNQHDAEFSEAGGQIIYCFDQTIFHLFFDTVQWRHAVSSFYGKEWSTSQQGAGRFRERWRRIEAQSALIASEYLLSDELPGAKNRYIYLTPWHRFELADRINKVASESIKDRTSASRIEREIKKKLEFLSSSRELLENSAENPFRPDELLEQDLAELKDYIHHPASLIRYELTRRAARMLVECEASERLDQVHRLVSRPLRQRIKSLHHLFRPTPSEVDHIAVDAEKWYLRIVSEVERHAHDRQDRRSPGGKWSDARSIAFVRWAATKTRPDQRLVLVTSDDRLFDAYRRWWCDEGITESGEPEPFVLRRSFQYTPIFNLRDSRNDLSRVEGMHNEVGKLFRQIADAVQITLLPFNLARIEQPDSRLGELAHNRSFEYMALRGRDYREGDPDPVLDYFLGRPDSAWYEQQRKAINDITGLWRDIERIGIGFFYDQVVKRLEDDRYLFGIDEIEAEPKSTEEALNYLSQALAAITDRTRRAYLPMALDFLEGELKDADGQSERAPDLLWYRLPSRQSVYDMIREWPKQKKNEREANIGELRRVPEAPFVLAAAFALAKHDWWKAEEFADYAFTAAGDEQGVTLTHAELLFLRAFAKRFRLGSSALADSRVIAGREESARSSVRRAAELFESTEKILEQYFELLQKLRPSQEIALLTVRGKSERAALRLFMALHRQFTGSGRTEPGERSPIEFVRDAQDDILSCLRLDKTISATDLRRRKQTIRNHFIHNGAASEVVRFVIEGNPHFQLDPRLAAIGQQFDQGPYRSLEEELPLVKSERIAFQILQGVADPLEWPELEFALATVLQSPLTIDRRFARAISERKDELFERLSRA